MAYFHRDGRGIPPGFLNPVVGVLRFDLGATSPDLGSVSPDLGLGGFRIDLGVDGASRVLALLAVGDCTLDREGDCGICLDGDCTLGLEGDLAGRVLPLELPGVRGVGEEVADPGREDVPEGRRLVVRFGMSGSAAF